MELPHKMNVAFVAAHFRNLIYRNIGSRKNELGMLYSAVYNFVHWAYAKYFFVCVFKM